jgi:signal transduction histidine kinase
MTIPVDLVVLLQIAFTVCVIFVLEGIAVYTWQFRAEPGARWHVWAQTCKCLWLAALAVAMLGGNEQWNVAGARATWFISIASPYIWYRFIAELSGFDRSAPRWLEPAIRIGVLFSWLLYLTNPWHHLIEVEVRRAGVLEEHYGVLCLFFTYPFAYSVNLLSAGLNVRWALRCRGLRRRQAWAFLAPNLFVWAGQFLSNMPWASTYDPHAFFFLLAGITTAWAFFRWRSYSVLPLAQEAMVRSTIDALVVMDVDGYIVRLNQAAQSIFPRVAAEGNRFESIAQDSPALLSLREAGAPQVLEANWEIAGSHRFFLVQTTSLYASAGWLLGQVFCFKDITQEKSQQACIVEQEKAISLLEERARIGRELHDGQGQSWSYVSMQLLAIERRMEQGEAARAAQLLKELRDSVQDSHIDLRETITALHIGRDTLKHGLLHAIEEQLRWYREHCGWQVHLELECEWQEEMLAPQSKVQLLRIVQQALANVRKHAEATRVRVAIQHIDGSLCFIIEDNGCGFDLDDAARRSGHHGLRMMRERADEIGAELCVHSSHETGTRVTVLLPSTDAPIREEKAFLQGQAQ